MKNYKYLAAAAVVGLTVMGIYTILSNSVSDYSNYQEALLKARESVEKDVMEEAINKEFMDELYRRTGMNPDDNFDGSARRFANNPQVLAMADDIRDYMIDMLLPETLLTGSLRYFADFRFADLGDSMTFDIENNALYNVSKAGYRKRSTNGPSTNAQKRTKRNTGCSFLYCSKRFRSSLRKLSSLYRLKETYHITK